MFENRKTCYVSLDKQGGEGWHNLRKCRATASLAAAMSGHLSPFIFETFYGSNEELAKQIVGTSSKSFTPEESKRMKFGIDSEPMIRKKYSEIIGKPIKELGLAIWKQDLRFGSSLDGEIDENEAIEIKAPQNMYKSVIEYFEAKKKGFTPPPRYHEHIYISHYDQMNMSGSITNKKHMHYIVMSANKDIYYQTFNVDYDYWEKEQYPKICNFMDTYVEPEMKRSGIKRIDPLKN